MSMAVPRWLGATVPCGDRLSGTGGFDVIDAWLDALRPGGGSRQSPNAVPRRAPAPDYVERPVRSAELSA